MTPISKSSYRNILSILNDTENQDRKIVDAEACLRAYGSYKDFEVDTFLKDCGMIDNEYLQQIATEVKRI